MCGRSRKKRVRDRDWWLKDRSRKLIPETTYIKDIERNDQPYTTP